MKVLICLLISWCLQTPDASHEQIRAQWLESLELDLPAEVVIDAQAHFQGSAAWAKDAQALALYARALYATGSQAQAKSTLLKASVPPSAQVHIELALARMELAEDSLDKLLQRLTTTDPEAHVRYPAQADSWWLIGKAQTRLGQGSQAAPYLQHFVQTWRMHPQGPAAWHLLSQAALSRRDLAAASKYRDQGQNLATWHGYYKTRRMQARAAPKDALPHFGLAQLWSSVQEHGRARSELNICLLLDPKMARAWALRGELDRQQEQLEGARQAYDRALELDPSLAAARFNRAMLALQAGDAQQAEIDLFHLVEGPESTTPRYLVAHLQLARLLQSSGQPRQAQARYGRYRELGGKESL